VTLHNLAVSDAGGAAKRARVSGGGALSTTRLQSVHTDTFAKERAGDLRVFVDGANPPVTGLRTYQTLPRHKRRRAMAHNVNRVPQRLRARAQLEVQEAKGGVLKSVRRYRRRVLGVARDHARRQRTKRWLETHVWHAKRMHMRLRWGVLLAETTTGKSVRATWRAENHMCTAHDASYAEPIELAGATDRATLLALMARITCAAASYTPGNAMFVGGQRAAHDVLVFAPDQYPRGFVAPCTLLWVGTDLWFWVHPAAADSLAGVLSVLIAGVAGLVLRRRPAELLCFELRGPHTARVLDAVLQPLQLAHAAGSAAAAQCDEWRVWRALRSLASLPDGVVLPLLCCDPRIAWPPKKSLHVTAAQHDALASQAAFDCNARSPLVLESPLWDEAARAAYRRNMDTQHAINRVRSRVAGADASTLRAPPLPAVLVVRRTATNLGAGAHGGQGGIDLYLPRGAGAGVWHALMFAGARPIGQVQRRSLAAERGTLSFPHDYVDCGAGRRFAHEVNDALRRAWQLRPSATKLNYARLGDAHALGDDWNRIVGLGSSARECLYFLARDRRLIAALQKPLDAAGAALPLESAPGALVSVCIRAIDRGVVDYNGALCIPTAEMLAELSGAARKLPSVPATRRRAPTVIGRVTSDRGFLLSQGGGGGTGAVALAAWLEFRRRAERVDKRFANQLLLKNIYTDTYRVVLVRAIV
jgi:ribonuclease P/MRP protein subunit POP1